MGRLTARRRDLRLGGPEPIERPDTLVVEEPLEIRVGGRALVVTMRTPGDDMDLAAGFLVSEEVFRNIRIGATIWSRPSSDTGMAAEAGASEN